MVNGFIQSTLFRAKKAWRSGWPLCRKDVLFGGFGFGNLGDDAAGGAFQKSWPRPLALVGPPTEDLWPSFWSPRVVFVGAGGVIKPKCNLFPRADVFTTNGVRMALLSAGLNRDLDQKFDPTGIACLRKLCARCEVLTVRDKDTGEFLSSLVTKEVRLLPDLALRLRSMPTKSTRPGGRPVLVVVLARHRPFLKARWPSLIGNIMGALVRLEALGWRIVFMPFQDDRKLLRLVTETCLPRFCDRGAVTVIEKVPQAREAVGIIQSLADVTLSVRLHGAVLSVAAGKPFVSLAYNAKHYGFARMVEMEDYVLDLRYARAEEIAERVLGTVQESEQLRQKLALRRSVLVERAEEEIRRLRRLMVG